MSTAGYILQRKWQCWVSFVRDCAHQCHSVWYFLDIELNCVLFKFLTCKITLRCSEELLQLCKRPREQRLCCLYHLYLSRSVFPHFLEWVSILVKRGPE